MTPMNYPVGWLTQDGADQMLSDCEARESRLSEWESGFVQSLRERLDAGRSLTPAQSETLERVWDRVTHKG